MLPGRQLDQGFVVHGGILVAQQLPPHTVDHCNQRGVRASPQHQLVECGIRCNRLQRAAPEAAERLVGASQFFDTERHEGGGERQGEALERGQDGEEFASFAIVQRLNREADSRRGEDKSFLMQSKQSFTYRSAADAKLQGELAFDQSRTGPVRSVQDIGEQSLVDAVVLGVGLRDLQLRSDLRNTVGSLLYTISAKLCTMIVRKLSRSRIFGRVRRRCLPSPVFRRPIPTASRRSTISPSRSAPRCWACLGPTERARVR